MQKIKNWLNKIRGKQEKSDCISPPTDNRFKATYFDGTINAITAKEAWDMVDKDKLKEKDHFRKIFQDAKLNTIFEDITFNSKKGRTNVVVDKLSEKHKKIFLDLGYSISETKSDKYNLIYWNQNPTE